MERTITPQMLQAFADALDKLETVRDGGIGTLGEKSVHGALKNYYEPLAPMHEYKVGRYVADIVNEDGITEIQTGNFRVMPRKLDAFLNVTHVTLVYPLVRKKTIRLIDGKTCEVIRTSVSPKHGQYTDAFYELYQILPYLFHPQLTVRLTLIDAEEYRIAGKPDRRGRVKTEKADRIPTALIGEYDLDSYEDYIALLPPLGEQFTSAQFAKALKRPAYRASYTLSFLKKLGVVVQSGNEGRKYLYSIVCPQAAGEDEYGKGSTTAHE